MKPDEGIRYRRRVVLEMVPDESDLLRQLAAKHGTMRGAILAGLRLLETDGSHKLRARLKTIEAQLTTAKTQAANAADVQRDEQLARESKAQRELAKVQAALDREQATHASAKKALTTANARGGRLERALRNEEGRRIAELYCSECGKLVPITECAEQGADIYHEEHGYRPKAGMLGFSNPTVIAKRVTASGPAGKGR